jgi:type IV pilus assembly protein PilO
MNVSQLKKINLRNPRTRNAALILLMGLGIIGYTYYQVIVPSIENLKQLQEAYRMKEVELNQILTMKTKLIMLRKQIVLDSMKLDSLRLKFPDKKEIPRLLQELTKVASVSGIYTVRFQPLPDVVKEYYIENKYTISVEGGYHELADFYSFLANMPLIVNLGAVAIRQSPEAVQSGDKDGYQDATVRSISATFEMTTFSSKK